MREKERERGDRREIDRETKREGKREGKNERKERERLYVFKSTFTGKSSIKYKVFLPAVSIIGILSVVIIVIFRQSLSN